VKDLNNVMDIVEHLLQALYVLPPAADQVAEHTPKRPSPPAAEKVVAINRSTKPQ